MLPYIRLGTVADAEAILEIYTPIVATTPISFELVPPSVDTMEQRITKTVAFYPWLVCGAQAKLYGYAYASAHRSRAAYQWAVDVSVYIHPLVRRRGVARALYTALLSILVEQGFYSAYAGIALPNAASVRLHESMGFEFIGIYRAVGYKLGAWRDVGWWQYDLAARPPDPELPRPIKDIIHTPRWSEILLSAQEQLVTF